LDALELKEGMRVYTEDGRPLGTIVQVRGELFEVVRLHEEEAQPPEVEPEPNALGPQGRARLDRLHDVIGAWSARHAAGR
jgi:hypothetical protein